MMHMGVVEGRGSASIRIRQGGWFDVGLGCIEMGQYAKYIYLIIS
jgi:hypothetical protein